MEGKRKRGEADGLDACELVERKATRTEGADAQSTAVNLVEVDGKSCTHQVVGPPGWEGPNAPPPRKQGPPAMEFPFSLDPFQQTAINALEAGDSVFVSAHTSAGKTVVAQYACALAARDNAKLIYTSPLKALSNQKYRELYDDFRDVGLLTGDVSINPNANCLVVTTEVLRCMLYDQAEILSEVRWIIYDEVHYLRDKERGVVWEECIILMPKNAQGVFLSATVPNAKQFAAWFANVHRAPCHVVHTELRPTPLQHYIFPSGSDGLYMVVDEKGTFREDNFQKASAEAQGESLQMQLRKKPSTKGTEESQQSDIFKLVKMIVERNYDPVILFCFSKKDCEGLALSMSQLDLINDEEKKLIEGIFNSAIDGLSEADRRLPQVINMLPMLRRGIGVHHAGLLPLVKEVIEVLFQEGLLKTLCATETFSTGLNMPAKTVVFTSARKYDGGQFRNVNSGEYIQMSGRAGRRGIDDRGIVILMMHSRMDAKTVRDLLKGGAYPIHSEFRVSYSMLLNMFKLEDSSPAQLIRSSFKQYLCEQSAPKLKAELKDMESQYSAVAIEDEQLVQQYYDSRRLRSKLKCDIRAILNKPKHCLPFLQPGRLVCISFLQTNQGQDLPAPDTVPSPRTKLPPESWDEEMSVWGAVVNFEKQKIEVVDDMEESRERPEPEYIVDVLVNCKEHQKTKGRSKGKESHPELTDPLGNGVPEVVGIPLGSLAVLSSVRVYLPRDLRSAESRSSAMRCVAEAIKRLQKTTGTVPELSPEEDMKVESSKFRKLRRQLESVESVLNQSPIREAPDLETRLGLVMKKEVLAESIASTKKELEVAGGLILKDELRSRERALRRLGFVDADGVVTVKGNVLLKLNSADDLVLVDLLFQGDLNDLSAPHMAAVVSCFVCEDVRNKSKANKVESAMSRLFQVVQGAARRVARVCSDCKLPINEGEFLGRFRPDLMEATLAWSNGAKFSDALKLVEVYEGSLVRAIRRLDQLLREVEGAVQLMGDKQLAETVAAAASSLERDIIFAASLYL
eukprot:evm.model.scf_2577.3 EVM.evm.TU.scf_2577.3   scf_2577:12172-20282(+)